MGEREGAKRQTKVGWKESKIEELLCFCCACSKTTIASAAFNYILLVYFLQLCELTVLQTS